jgi:stage III sporulation protein AD
LGIIKVVVAAVSGCILGAVLKNAKSNIAPVLSIIVSVFILFYVVMGLDGVVEEFKILQSYVSISGKYIAILIKVVGISYLTQLAADICRDNGYSAIAGQLEIFCKITIALLSMPVVLALFEVVSKCVE